MLSRIADSLFWIARYMERAEDTARILDVQYYLLLQGGQRPEARPETIFDFLASSIVECITRARENARAIRDRITREMWEDLNGLYLELHRLRMDEVRAAGPHHFCNLVKFGSYRFQGVSDATLPHDEGWQFLQVGRALERAHMTARIVDVQHHAPVEEPPGPDDAQNHRWMAVLKSVAAYDVYRRRHTGRIDPEKVAELLILDPRHPRSIRFNIAALEAGLHAISGAAPETYGNEAERLVGRLNDTLKYDRIADVFARGLRPFLEDVQRACQDIGDQVARTYFCYAVAS
jgi:uncharacterized alpha-E superfamily protein